MNEKVNFSMFFTHSDEKIKLESSFISRDFDMKDGTGLKLVHVKYSALFRSVSRNYDQKTIKVEILVFINFGLDF